MVKDVIFGAFLTIASIIAVLSGLELLWGIDFGYTQSDFYWSIGLICFGILFYDLTGRAHRLIFPKQKS